MTLDPAAGLARVITSGASRKARQVAAAGRGGRGGGRVPRGWPPLVTIEGRAVLRSDPAAVAEAERRYAERYRTPRPNPERVVIEITVTRLLGSL